MVTELSDANFIQILNDELSAHRGFVRKIANMFGYPGNKADYNLAAILNYLETGRTHQ